ncbi:DNA adenine methylase [Lactococcus petauri]|uniref:DNA adenine methylase n=1 Tax=Lactococcus petauri TaxID=1940789 RepID=UPI0030CF4A4A
MKRVLNYPGSKWGSAELIIDLMPEHKSYLELFAGSLAVFFNKSKDTLETVNDIDGRLVNLWKIMRDRSEELQRAVHMTLYSREEYEISKEISENELEDARRMLVRCWFAVGGKTNADVGFRRNISWNGPYNTYEWSTMPIRIQQAADRLKNAQIERKDAVVLLKEMNDKDTLVYADPPYLHETRKSKHYTNEMDKTQHVELLKALKKHKGPVILSGYESDLYNTELSDWWKMTFEQQVGITTKKKRTATEVLWFNFEPSGQMNLFEETK